MIRILLFRVPFFSGTPIYSPNNRTAPDVEALPVGDGDHGRGEAHSRCRSGTGEEHGDCHEPH